MLLVFSAAAAVQSPTTLPVYPTGRLFATVNLPGAVRLSASHLVNFSLLGHAPGRSKNRAPYAPQLHAPSVH